MSMVKQLFIQARASMLIAVGASMVSAAVGITLIGSVNYALEHGIPSLQWGIAFYVLMLALLFISGVWSQKLLVGLGHDMVYRLRLTLVSKILNTPLARQEQLGAPVLYNALTRDVTVVANATKQLPISLYNGLLLIAGTLYLAWLSPLLFMCSAIIMVLGVWGDFALAGRIKAIMTRVRQKDEELFQQYEALIEGRNELGLSQSRRQFLRDERIEPCAKSARDQAINADVIWAMNLNWTTVLVFALIGLVFFLGITLESITQEIVVGYVLAAMFLRTPIAMILEAIPAVIRGNVALSALDQLVLGDEPSSQPKPIKTSQFISLRAEQAMYEYPPSGDERGFVLGPVNFAITTGQLIFLIGGNGSGKSTLAKLLTGLYIPSSGRVSINGNRLDQENQAKHCAYFSTIFPNFYLFDDVLDAEGALGEGGNNRIDYYLDRLSIRHKVSVTDGKLSTKSLSQGQRKRLALLLVYMEDKQVLLLDEWAADQDPLFREIFYREILPELTAAGKTIIAITHDDHYFDAADAIYRLDNGVISPYNIDTDTVFTSKKSTKKSTVKNNAIKNSTTKKNKLNRRSCIRPLINTF